MKIPCTCINDRLKPEEIPQSKWVVKGHEYHITHIYNNIQQNGIKGVELFEHDISECLPYNCYRLDRFAFTEENLKKLIEMMKDCTELNNVDISSIVEKLTSVEELDGII